jgi:ribonuclease-3
VTFHDTGLLKLALTHRSYLSVTGQGPRESNERLEFLGDSVLGLVTSEFLYRRHPDEHEGQLTKTKSLLVSKAILSRRALRMGLGRFVLMSHSEVESGGRQRLSILADAFESVLGAVYLDQGFETARKFIHDHLLEDSDEIVADKRHTNYKSHLQEYVQSTYRTHPVYRIRSEYGPDHSKHFMVEVMVGRRTLGVGRGHNKKEAEQAAARDALENVKRVRSEESPARGERPAETERETGESRRRRRRRGGRGRGDDARDAGRGRGRGSAFAAEPADEAAPADAEFDVEVLQPGREVARGADEDDDVLEDEPADVVDDLDDDDVVEEIDDDDEADDEDEDEADDVEEDEDDDEGDDEGDAPVRARGAVVEDADDDLDEAGSDDEDEDAPARAPDPPVRPEPRPRYGRSSRRGGRRRAPPPAAGPAPEAATEALHVDPFELGKADTSEPEPAEQGQDERIAEIERAMSNFGQRRSEGYGRRSRPSRRGR